MEPHVATSDRATILLADDDESVRPMLAQTLRRYGYEVLEASNGTEALELFEVHTNRIRLLVTDVVMPDVNGPALVARLREQMHRLPVLYITGYGHHEGVEPDDLLMHKPFTPHAFAKAVTEMLR